METLELKFKHDVFQKKQQMIFNVKIPQEDTSDPLCFLFQREMPPKIFLSTQATQTRVRQPLPFLKQHFNVQQVTTLSP